MRIVGRSTERVCDRVAVDAGGGAGGASGFAATTGVSVAVVTGVSTTAVSAVSAAAGLSVAGDAAAGSADPVIGVAGAGAAAVVGGAGGLGVPGVDVTAADVPDCAVDGAGVDKRGRAGALLRGGRGMRRGELEARGAADAERVDVDDEEEPRRVTLVDDGDGERRD